MVGRNFALKYIRENKLFSKDKDIYLFGIYTGVSVQKINDVIRNDLYHKIYGLDSFMGLPKEIENIKCFEGHKEGVFDSRQYFQENSIKKIQDIIYQKVNNQKLELIPGYYKDSLNENLLKEKQFKPAVFIDIDVDLYISTIDLLNFMFSNNLIQKNCVIYLDDFGGVELYTGGESLAWKEMTEKYNIKYKEIWSWENGIHLSKVFVIL